MDFALNEIDTVSNANEGVVVPLVRLDGEPLLNAKKEIVSLILLGADSAAYRRLRRELTRKSIERQQKNRGKPLSDEQLDQAEADEIRLLAQVTAGWNGILDTADKPVPFTLENVIDLYTKFPIARDQAEAAVLDRARFTKPSSQG